MRVAVIIPAAGSGQRMGGVVPKQFLLLGRQPILLHTLKSFLGLKEIKRIVIALPQKKLHALDKFLVKHNCTQRVLPVVGGQNRQDSVYNGFIKLDDSIDLVLVHDGVRPFIDQKLIRRVMRASAEAGAAVPVMPLTDSIRRLAPHNERSSLVPREEYLCIQTPQGFRYSILGEALEKARRDRFYSTDESSLVERIGYDVALVQGSEWNIKITRPIDMLLAKAILRRLYVQDRHRLRFSQIGRE